MEKHLQAASLLANLLDNQFNFLGKRFGVAGFIGMIPVVGDFIVFALSFYLVWIGIQMRLPIYRLIQMVANIVINFLVDLVPIVGDIVYFLRKANMKNLKILESYAKKHVIEGEVINSSQSLNLR